MPSAPNDEDFDDDGDAELTDSWRPQRPPPARAAGIPEDATWDDDAWRWASGPIGAGGVRDGDWRFWAMNGHLIQERSYAVGVETSLTAYYADGTVAAKSATTHGDMTFESFYRDGKPWCVARYRNVTGDSIEADQVVTEKLWTQDGALFRELANEYDADGLVTHRERSGPNLRFENLRTADGRELRLYVEGTLEWTLRHKKSADKALVILPSNKEMVIDGSEIGERTTRGQIEPELGGRIFAVTISDEPQSAAVKAFTAKNAWAKKISKDAPFENASVANFLTALDSKLPHVALLGGVGLGNLIESDKHRNAVIPFLEALGTPAAKAALQHLGVSNGEDEQDNAAKAHAGEHAIGSVTVPSGILTIVDMGALGQWSHEAPHHADVSGSKWAVLAGKHHDDYVDLIVTGAQAKQALAQFVASHGASELFDVEKDSIDEIRAHFVEHTEGLDAKLEISPERIGHGARLRLLRDAGLAYADFDFAHVNVVAVFGVANAELSVVGQHDDEGSWDHVSLVLKDSAPVREEEIARLSIEEARFMFADGEALKDWDHDRSLDGLRDFVFWGGAEDEMVAATGAELAYADYYGWADLPPGALAPHIVTRVLRQVEEGALVAEVRAHSSHHAILRQAWQSADKAGTATIGGAKMCGLFSSVGDGVFPVYFEYDAAGAVCRVTVKITGAPEEDEEDDEDEDEGD